MEVGIVVLKPERDVLEDCRDPPRFGNRGAGARQIAKSLLEALESGAEDFEGTFLEELFGGAAHRPAIIRAAAGDSLGRFGGCMNRTARRFLLVVLAVAASLHAMARVPEKVSGAAPLQVTYYFLPG